LIIKKSPGCTRTLGSNLCRQQGLEPIADKQNIKQYQVYHKDKKFTSKLFIVTPYEPDINAALHPKVPLQGPCGADDDRSCQIDVHHIRERKTGPCFPLTVIQCKTHNKHFTLYPPGHTPHGRKAIAPVAPDGSWPLQADMPPAGDDDECRGKQSHQDKEKMFRGTLFDAAMDAASMNAWNRCSPELGQGGELFYWSTMGRDLHRLTVLFGMSKDRPAPEREIMAALLGVGGLLLHEQSNFVLKYPGYKERGKAVCTILFSLTAGSCFLDRLLNCGHFAGLWGRPYQWDDDTAQLRSSYRFPP
jgi:hypothetical protein